MKMPDEIEDLTNIVLISTILACLLLVLFSPLIWPALFGEIEIYNSKTGLMEVGDLSETIVIRLGLAFIFGVLPPALMVCVGPLAALAVTGLTDKILQFTFKR